MGALIGIVIGMCVAVVAIGYLFYYITRVMCNMTEEEIEDFYKNM